MRYNKKKIILYLLIIFIGIGSAYLSTRLRINGTAEFVGQTWDIYFDNVEVSNGSVSANAPVLNTKTSVSYSISFKNPGEYYEFTVDAVNDGTIDAMIDSVVKTELSNDILEYITYQVTYLDGSEIKQKDLLKADSSVTYKIYVKFSDNVESLPDGVIDFTLSFGVNYVQSDIEDNSSVFIDLVKNSALSDEGLDFKQISSVSNGRGLYIRSGTESNTYPIYYYRGNVSNNNALFAGFCWKVVRTTDTGGVKLIYNGNPDANGHCTNTEGSVTQLSERTKFNEYQTSPVYLGYMYGEVYNRSTQSTSSSHIYGKSFTYTNGSYTLSNTKSGVDDTHHYTCFSSSTSCTNISYVYYLDGSTAYYITLTNGKSVSDALAEMNVNTHDSVMKTTVDAWFNNTIKTYFTTQSKNYNDYLEDTVWCNDRSIYQYGGWNPDGGSISNYLQFGAFGRRTLGTPTLICPNKNDAFTVSDTTTGNGALTYPIGLLTGDEMILAGGANADNTDFYLYTGNAWWGMTPLIFFDQLAYEFYVHYTGKVNGTIVFVETGLRPSISIKSHVKIKEGSDGTSSKPYEFIIA